MTNEEERWANAVLYLPNDWYVENDCEQVHNEWEVNNRNRINDGWGAPGDGTWETNSTVPVNDDSGDDNEAQVQETGLEEPLPEDHECRHDTYQILRGRYDCEVCDWTATAFLYRYNTCDLLVCRRCRSDLLMA